MTRRNKTKYIHEGEYVAAVDVELLEDDTAWTPYLSLEDAYRIDDVRDALRRRDFQTAGQYGRVYHLERIDV